MLSNPSCVNSKLFCYRCLENELEIQTSEVLETSEVFDTVFKNHYLKVYISDGIPIF